MDRDVAAVLMLVFLTAVQRLRVLAAPSDTQNCYASSSATVSCIVHYQSSLTLHCPNTTNPSTHGEWWKQSSTTTDEPQAICYERNCTIDEPLHNKDSGQYFCQMSDRKFFANVTVLAPPSIVCNPEFCTCYNLTKTCRQPLIAKVWDEDIVLTTKFTGQGPLSVEWEHRGRVLDCSSDSRDNVKCTIIRGKTESYEYETLTLPGPHGTEWYSGTYTANVSNPYGYNMTKQFVEIVCPIVEPPRSPGNQTTSLTQGQTRHVTLTTRGSRKFYMWVCFTTDPHLNMWNIDLNTSCIKCKDTSCNSAALPNRPGWTVHRNETGCSGDSIIDMSVLVKDFSKRDAGRLMLTWSTDSLEQGPQQHRVLTVTSLHYKESVSGYVYAGIGVGGGCVVLGVSVVTAVIGRFWYKRKKTAAQRARRIAERRHAARIGGGRGRGGGGEEASDNDNDEHNPIRGANRDYGTIPRQANGHGINSDTATSEIEHEVVLQTDSDGTAANV